jgi:hypothetical protein
MEGLQATQDFCGEMRGNSANEDHRGPLLSAIGRPFGEPQRDTDPLRNPYCERPLLDESRTERALRNEVEGGQTASHCGPYRAPDNRVCDLPAEHGS